MSEERLTRIESAVEHLVLNVSKLSESLNNFITLEASRTERDKRQIEINDQVLKHLKKFDTEYLPVITKAKTYHDWVGNFALNLFGKWLVGLIILSAAYATLNGII